MLGVPFYGRGWSGVKNVNNGLYQPHGKTPPKGTWEAGIFDYKDLAANYLGKFKRHWHDEAKAPWLYDEKTGVMISYDDAESLRIKAEYANEHRLGGVMFWELSADDAKSTLLNALHKARTRSQMKPSLKRERRIKKTFAHASGSEITRWLLSRQSSESRAGRESSAGLANSGSAGTSSC